MQHTTGFVPHELKRAVFKDSLPSSLLSALHVCRHVGLLTIEVLEARGLKKYDILGKSDPFIELSTQPLSKEKTSVKKKTLMPHWNETKHVLVQVRPAVIPPDAGLRVVMCWWLTLLHGTHRCKTDANFKCLPGHTGAQHAVLAGGDVRPRSLPAQGDSRTPDPDAQCQLICSASAQRRCARSTFCSSGSSFPVSVC
jgi:C2 domain